MSRRLLLAIDTTSEFGSFALAEDGRVLEEVALHSPDGFAHVCFREIERCSRGTISRSPTSRALPPPRDPDRSPEFAWV